ncbi:unnamed protein product [Knipowitschia caucasica]|uniref:Uncharacterized protein n=1 Tax=Knipowitschia caucasica TaxID=637954 RepID=A0AAV2JW66_KNICA
MRIVLVLSLAAALCAVLFAGPNPKPTPKPRPTKAPVQSSCKAIWLFTTPCAEINSTLIQQVKVFSPNAGCGDCNYLFVSADNVTLTVDHTSADGFGAETISFKFTPSLLAPGCQMFVQSQSIGPTTTTDDAINYCNIYNLLTGSGLDLQPGFLDKTNKWVCPAIALTKCTTQ